MPRHLLNFIYQIYIINMVWHQIESTTVVGVFSDLPCCWDYFICRIGIFVRFVDKLIGYIQFFIRKPDIKNNMIIASRVIWNLLHRYYYYTNLRVVGQI